MAKSPTTKDEPKQSAPPDEELIAAALRQEFGPSGKPPAKPLLPERIGPYKIVRRIGAGGMGIVYEAEQAEPNRRVALKVIRSQAETGSEHGRLFRREIQVLGQLRHPSIAQIYDAGQTEDGQQYFAMELIDGQPLTEFCESADLGLPDRLVLLADVCEAVHYAHQRGVIHRDLKPANILVDEAGAAHVLDFGLAKFVDPDMEMTRSLLEAQALIGTLPYMSPEQVSGDASAVDTGCDVYALGVIGYELLTGRLPYNLNQKSFPEAVRIISEEDPTPLSSMDRVLRGDVDTIFAKALEKEKSRRYASAHALADDIRRHLRDEPISASPTSTWHRIRKVVRRNKGFAGAVAAVFLVLVVGTVVSTLFYFQAQKEANNARQTLAFLEDLFRSVDPFGRYGPEITVGTMMELAAAEIEAGAIPDDPIIRASIRSTIGETSKNLGLYDTAQPLLEDVVENLRRRIGANHPDTLRASSSLAEVLWRQGTFDKAKELIEETLDAQRRLLGEEHSDTLFSATIKANVRRGLRDYVTAEQIHRDTHAIRQRVLGDEHVDTLKSWDNVGVTLQFRGKHEAAEQIHRETLEVRRRVLGEDHPHVFLSMNNLGTALAAQEKWDEAEEIHRTSFETARRVLGDTHPHTLTSLDNFSRVLAKRGKHEQLAEKLAWLRAGVSADNSHLDNLLLQLGSAYIRSEQFAKAEPLFVESLQIRERTLPDGDPQILSGQSNLGNIYVRWGNYAKGEQIIAAALANKALKKGQAPAGMLLLNYGTCLTGLGRHEVAEKHLLEAHEILDGLLKSSHPITIRAVNKLIDVYEAVDNPNEAAEWRAKLPTDKKTEPAKP